MVGLTVASTVSLHNQYNLSQPILLMGDISPTARSGLYPDDLRSAARRSTAPDFNQASSLDPWLSTSSQVSARDLNEQQPRQSQQWRSRRHGSSALPLDDSTAIYGRIWWTHSTGSPPFRPFTFSSDWVPQRHQCNSTNVTDALHNETDTFTRSETTTLQAESDTTGMYAAPQAAAPRVLCSTPSLSRILSRIHSFGYNMFDYCPQHVGTVSVLLQDSVTNLWVATIQVTLPPASRIQLCSCLMLSTYGSPTTSQRWSMSCAGGYQQIQVVAQSAQCDKAFTAFPVLSLSFTATPYMTELARNAATPAAHNISAFNEAVCQHWPSQAQSQLLNSGSFSSVTSVTSLDALSMMMQNIAHTLRESSLVLSGPPAAATTASSVD
jgi:hypothetical protein